MALPRLLVLLLIARFCLGWQMYCPSQPASNPPPLSVVFNDSLSCQQTQSNLFSQTKCSVSADCVQNLILNITNCTVPQSALPTTTGNWYVGVVLDGLMKLFCTFDSFLCVGEAYNLLLMYDDSTTCAIDYVATLKTRYCNVQPRCQSALPTIDIKYGGSFACAVTSENLAFRDAVWQLAS